MTALANPTSQLPQVSWTAPASPGFTIARYNVYRDTGLSPVGVINVPSTTFTDSGISSGTYSYRVVAVSNDGVPILGVPSAAVTVVYDTVAPSAPGGVTATGALDGSVGISWAAASDGAGSGIVRYVVRRSLSSSAPVSASDGDATCQGLFTSCADATTLNGKLYSYAVFAVDAVGNTSPAGSSAAVTARDQLAPGGPKGLVATPGDASVDLPLERCGGGRRRGRVRARRQAGQRRARERGRRHARLHRDRRRVDRVLGERAHERRHVHVRSLRTRRGAQPLAGGRRERGAERQGDRRRRRRPPSPPSRRRSRVRRSR